LIPDDSARTRIARFPPVGSGCHRSWTRRAMNARFAACGPNVPIPPLDVSRQVA
jgi:hypothetical protein